MKVLKFRKIEGVFWRKLQIWAGGNWLFAHWTFDHMRRRLKLLSIWTSSLVIL